MNGLSAVLVWLVAMLAMVQGAYYHTLSGKQISEAKFRQYQLQNLVPYCALEVKDCDAHERRRLDYSCNNLHFPQRGATLTPYRRMLPPDFDPNFNHRPSSSGAPLPLARAVRVGVIPDGRVASKHYTHLLTNALIVITADITSFHDTANYVAITTTCCETGPSDPRCIPFYVPEDDLHLRRSDIRCLNLTRAITYQTLGCAPRTTTPERINTSPPMLDLSIIYGTREDTARKGREFTGGRLRTEVVNGREWPPNGSFFCIGNQVPRGETRCNRTPAQQTNVLMGSNVFSIWVYRLHNLITRELQRINPCWDDERLYYEAREINIAYLNQIWYYELMVAILGYDYLLDNHVIYDTMGHVDDYDHTLEPRVSIEYIIGTRWFHNMQDGRTNMYDRHGKFLDQLDSVELILRTGILTNNRTMEGITQGYFRQPSAAADHVVDPDIGERILGSLQRASDVVSSDLMKGRDVGLPPYNKYRQYCHLPVARDFEDLKEWMPEEQVEALMMHYEVVDDIDIVAGILAEDPMPHAATGPTLACIMADQLLYWRRADRFWYENTVHPGAFTEEQLYEIRRMTAARLLCDTGDEVDAVQPQAFLLPGPGNEIVDCKNIQAPSLEPWRDHSCKANPNP